MFTMLVHVTILFIIVRIIFRGMVLAESETTNAVNADSGSTLLNPTSGNQRQMINGTDATYTINKVTPSDEYGYDNGTSASNHFLLNNFTSGGTSIPSDISTSRTTTAFTPNLEINETYLQPNTETLDPTTPPDVTVTMEGMRSSPETALNLKIITNGSINTDIIKTTSQSISSTDPNVDKLSELMTREPSSSPTMSPAITKTMYSQPELFFRGSTASPTLSSANTADMDRQYELSTPGSSNPPSTLSASTIDMEPKSEFTISTATSYMDQQFRLLTTLPPSPSSIMPTIVTEMDQKSENSAIDASTASTKRSKITTDINQQNELLSSKSSTPSSTGSNTARYMIQSSESMIKGSSTPSTTTTDTTYQYDFMTDKSSTPSSKGSIISRYVVQPSESIVKGSFTSSTSTIEIKDNYEFLSIKSSTPSSIGTITARYMTQQPEPMIKESSNPSATTADPNRQYDFLTSKSSTPSSSGSNTTRHMTQPSESTIKESTTVTNDEPQNKLFTSEASILSSTIGNLDNTPSALRTSINTPNIKNISKDSSSTENTTVQKAFVEKTTSSTSEAWFQSSQEYTLTAQNKGQNHLVSNDTAILSNLSTSSEKPSTIVSNPSTHTDTSIANTEQTNTVNTRSSIPSFTSTLLSAWTQSVSPMTGKTISPSQTPTQPIQISSTIIINKDPSTNTISTIRSFPSIQWPSSTSSTTVPTLTSTSTSSNTISTVSSTQSTRNILSIVFARVTKTTLFEIPTPSITLATLTTTLPSIYTRAVTELTNIDASSSFAAINSSPTNIFSKTATHSLYVTKRHEVTTSITVESSTTSILYEHIIQIVFKNEVWIEDYSNRSSVRFINKLADIRQSLMDGLRYLNISIITIYDLKHGSIVANTSLKFYKYVPLSDLSTEIEKKWPGSIVSCDTKLSAWAVTIISILGVLTFNVFWLLVIAVLWWRHRAKTRGIYDVELCEKKNGWIYPYRYMVHQKSRL